MKIRICLKWLFAAGLLAPVQAGAQMEAARKMSYDIDTLVRFNVALPVLWEALKEPAHWAGISNGSIASIRVSGDLPHQTRTVRFADGTERKDSVLQYQPEYRFIVFKIKEPLAAAIEDNILAFTAATEGKGLSSLHIMIKVEGREDEKKELLDALRKEAEGYAEGLAKRFAQEN